MGGGDASSILFTKGKYHSPLAALTPRTSLGCSGGGIEAPRVIAPLQYPAE